MNIKGLTVVEVIEAIANKETSTGDIATELSSSERTVQRKIKSLGYKWNQLNTRHEPTGDSYKSENDSVIFSDLFGDNQKELLVAQAKVAKNADKVVEIATKEAVKPSEEIASTSEESVKPKSTGRAKSKDKDMLDMFLGDQSNRIQRNYYMQEDVLSVVDKVHTLKRSEFINQCLRQYFKDNNLL